MLNLQTPHTTLNGSKEFKLHLVDMIDAFGAIIIYTIAQDYSETPNINTVIFSEKAIRFLINFMEQYKKDNKKCKGEISLLKGNTLSLEIKEMDKKLYLKYHFSYGKDYAIKNLFSYEDTELLIKYFEENYVLTKLDRVTEQLKKQEEEYKIQKEKLANITVPKDIDGDIAKLEKEIEVLKENPIHIFFETHQKKTAKLKELKMIKQELFTKNNDKIKS